MTEKKRSVNTGGNLQRAFKSKLLGMGAILTEKLDDRLNLAED
jgi:hypothetical protein